MKKSVLVAIALVLAGTTSYAFRVPDFRAWATAALGNLLYPSRAVTVPPGTPLLLRLRDRLAADAARAGDTFRCETGEPLVLEGQVVVPAGAAVAGHVLSSAPADERGAGKLVLSFDRLTLGLERIPLGATAEIDETPRAGIPGNSFRELLGDLLEPPRRALSGLVSARPAEASPRAMERPRNLVLVPGTLLQVRLDHALTVHVPPL